MIPLWRGGWVIRGHWGSREDPLVQLGKVEPRTLTPPKPHPAPRGLDTQPQAVKPSRGVRGVGGEGGRDHQRPLGELRGPTGPAVRDVEGWVKMGKLVLPLWAADWPWEALFLSVGCIRRFEYNLMIRGVAGGSSNELT